jgi:hypothetical protein
MIGMKVKYKSTRKKEWRIWSFEVRERIEVEEREVSRVSRVRVGYIVETQLGG